MKTFSIWLALLGLTLSLHAQEVAHTDLAWSNLLKPKTLNNVYKEKFGNKFCMFWAYENYISMRVFNDEMQMTEEHEIKWMHPADGEVIYSSHVNAYGDFYMITRVELKEKKRFDFFLQKVNTETFEVEGDPIFLTTINYLREGFLEHPEFYFSENEEHILVAHNNIKDGNRFYTLRVFDNAFELKDELSMEHGSEDYLRTREFVISNSGRIAAFYVYEIPKKLRQKGKPSKAAVLVDMAEGQINPLDIGDIDFYVNDAELVLTEKDEVVVMGYYSLENTDYNVGIFVMREESAGSGFNSELYPFTQSDIGYFMNDKDRAALKKDLAKGDDRHIEQGGFMVRHIIPLSDGGYYLIGEVSNRRNEISSFGLQVGSAYGLDGIIMVTRFDKNFEMSWNSQIGKKNLDGTFGGRWGSFQYMKGADNSLYFLHTDSKENATRKERDGIIDARVKGKDAATVLTKVDNEGEVTKEVLFTEPDVELLTVPRFSFADERTKQFTVWVMAVYAPLRVKLGSFTIED
ncbi:hypothetical protein KFE98_14160 [bacterium SCSIO 12741]|nr:hypothetical protein KFE98_14160 [bacterium SCSIO 12741]